MDIMWHDLKWPIAFMYFAMKCNKIVCGMCVVVVSQWWSTEPLWQGHHTPLRGPALVEKLSAWNSLKRPEHIFLVKVLENWSDNSYLYVSIAPLCHICLTYPLCENYSRLGRSPKENCWEVMWWFFIQAGWPSCLSGKTPKMSGEPDP